MIKSIAEIGWNHMGDIKLAEKMIISAKNAGCSHAKFQNWSTSNLKSGPWDHDGRREIYEEAELTQFKTIEIYNICQKNNIKFLTSIFSVNDVNFLSKISNETIKIASPEMRNLTLLSNCAKNFNEIILSTGAANLKEVKESVDFIKNENSNCKITLMHCVSIYPCPDNKVRLNRINLLKKIHPKVGLSDHTQDGLSSILSLSLGINAIEKHFTIDNDLPGRDNKFAIMYDEFKKINNAIKRYELMSQSENLDTFLDEEKEVREVYSGRWSK